MAKKAPSVASASQATAEPVRPTPAPPPTQKAIELATATLDAGQQKKYDFILSEVSKPDLKVASERIESSELTPEERMWLSRECILRYLRATKWNEKDAVKRLNATLVWRRDYGMTNFLTPEYVEPEGETGKLIIFEWDQLGRPSLYMLPGRQNTNGPERQLQFTFWMMEAAIIISPPGVESMNILLDFASKANSTSVDTARKMLNYLQNHYPERLGKFLVINVPWLVNAFISIVMPFVDPLTREKIRFNPQVVKEGLYREDAVTVPWGGSVPQFPDPWPHQEYWSTLKGMVESRKAEMMKNWEAAGGKIGTSEWVIKTGSPPGTAQKTEDSSANGNSAT